jgi:hypothetical protein
MMMVLEQNPKLKVGEEFTTRHRTEIGILYLTLEVLGDMGNDEYIIKIKSHTLETKK